MGKIVGGFLIAGLLLLSQDGVAQNKGGQPFLNLGHMTYDVPWRTYEIRRGYGKLMLYPKRDMWVLEFHYKNKVDSRIGVYVTENRGIAELVKASRDLLSLPN